MQVTMPKRWTETFSERQRQQLKKLLVYHARRLKYKRVEVLTNQDGIEVDPPLGTLTYVLGGLPSDYIGRMRRDYTSILEERELKEAAQRVEAILKSVVNLNVGGLIPDLVCAQLDKRIRSNACFVQLGQERTLVAVAINHAIYFTPILVSIPFLEGLVLLNEALRRIKTIPTKGVEITKGTFPNFQDTVVDCLRVDPMQSSILKGEAELFEELNIRREMVLYEQWRGAAEAVIKSLASHVVKKVAGDISRLLKEHPGVRSIHLYGGGFVIFTETVIAENEGVYYDLGAYEINIRAWTLRSVREVSRALLPHPRIITQTFWMPEYREAIHEALSSFELYLGVDLILQALRDIADGLTDIHHWPGYTLEEILAKYPNLDPETLWPKKE